jgi:hypothetical protein
MEIMKLITIFIFLTFSCINSEKDQCYRNAKSENTNGFDSCGGLIYNFDQYSKDPNRSIEEREESMRARDIQILSCLQGYINLEKCKNKSSVKPVIISPI